MILKLNFAILPDARLNSCCVPAYVSSSRGIYIHSAPFASMLRVTAPAVVARFDPLNSVMRGTTLRTVNSGT